MRGNKRGNKNFKWEYCEQYANKLKSLHEVKKFQEKYKKVMIVKDFPYKKPQAQMILYMNSTKLWRKLMTTLANWFQPLEN